LNTLERWNVTPSPRRQRRKGEKEKRGKGEQRSFEFIVLSLEFSPTHPKTNGREGGNSKLKTQNSKLKTKNSTL
jgi:hypothetical protein